MKRMKQRLSDSEIQRFPVVLMIVTKLNFLHRKILTSSITVGSGFAGGFEFLVNSNTTTSLSIVSCLFNIFWIFCWIFSRIWMSKIINKWFSLMNKWKCNNTLFLITFNINHFCQPLKRLLIHAMENKYFLWWQIALTIQYLNFIISHAWYITLS